MMSETDETQQTPNEPADQGAPSPVEGVNSHASEGEAPLDALADLRAEADRLKDLWMRTAADFDNYRKRSRREAEDAKRAGREELLRDMLPVFDNLERAITSSQRATDVKAVADGLVMVVKQFTDTLTRAGISKVPSVGNPFDPSVHEAIQQLETSDHPAGTVIAEVQPGYVQGDRLVRAAMVVVATPKKAEGEAN